MIATTKNWSLGSLGVKGPIDMTSDTIWGTFLACRQMKIVHFICLFFYCRLFVFSLDFKSPNLKKL